jgi:murein DD-endopeptidase MepM/ murein hydrolase activator NlpD
MPATFNDVKFRVMMPTDKILYSIPKRLKWAVSGFALFLVLSISGGWVGEGGKQSLTFVHRERALQPGEVIIVSARSSRPLQYLRAYAFDGDFPGFGGKGGVSWTSLIGIDLETAPGRYSIELKGADLDGKSVSARKIVNVIGKKFPVRRLEVDEKFVTPPVDVLSRIEKERERTGAIFSSITSEKFWRGPFRIPVPGEVISVFGKRNVYNGQARSPHAGVDFRGAIGTPVHAPNRGRVALATDLYFSGNTVILDHGLGLYTYLAHMSEISVKEGDVIERGSIIGKVGATGRVTGPHLHWTIRIGRARVDPLSLINVLGDL